MPHTNPVTCPKCKSKCEADACPRCGLILNKWHGLGAQDTQPPELHASWQNVLENWDTSAAHALFVERCLAAGAADYAAKKYHDRDDDPVAREQLERLTTRLLQNIYGSTKRTKSRTSHRTLRAVLALLLTAAVIAVVFWLIAS